MAKRKTYIQSNIVDRLRTDSDYLDWWNSLLSLPEYKAVQLFVILDKEKTKRDKGVSHWNPLPKPEFERLYREGKLNGECVSIPDSMKTLKIVLDVGLSCFLDPNPKHKGMIFVNTAEMIVSSDRPKNISPHENHTLPEYMTRKGKAVFRGIYRKNVLKIRAIKDEAPTDAATNPDSRRARLNKKGAEYIKLMKRILKKNPKSKYLQLDDPRVKDIFKGLSLDEQPKKKTLQNWACQARKK
jgi:hypothetical protein